MKSLLNVLENVGFDSKPISLVTVAQSFKLVRPLSLSFFIDSSSPDDYATLYGKLRASVLSRHFALNKYFRTNLILPDKTLGTSNTTIEEFLSKDPLIQLIERWKIKEMESGGENPLMFMGLLFTNLAVEAHLGSNYALRIIKKALFSLSTLFKFHGEMNFDGYIIRGDPVTRIDRWVIEQNKKYCERFLINSNNTYNYCAPTNDPRYRRLDINNDKADDWGRNFRYNEPSMDEYVGLLAGYFIVYLLVQDQEVRTMIRDQVGKIADYLDAHGYILVRPYGGFSYRGHSGILPSLEYPFNRIFNRITGKSYSSNVNFEDAVKKAHMWNCLNGPYMWDSIAGVALSIALPILVPVLTILGLVGMIKATGTIFTPVQLGRALAILDAKVCFDTTAKGEFAGAYLLKQIGDTRQRFEIFMNGIFGVNIIATMKASSWATGFLPYIGILGLDDDQDVIKNAYLNWFKARRNFNQTKPSEGDFDNSGEKGCFACAIALLLGTENKEMEEAELVKRLKRAYDEIHGKYKDDIPIKVTGEGTISEQVVVVPRSDKGEPYTPSVLDYMAGLALAWLYSKRQCDKGTPVTTKGFPKTPTNLDQIFPKAVVPKEIWSYYKTNNIDFRIKDIQNTTDIDKTKDADLFTDSAPEKTPVPSPILLPIVDTSRIPDIDIVKTVKESDWDMDTYIRLYDGDIYEFSDIGGTIWAGVLLTGRNGPDGWTDRKEGSVHYPLHIGIDHINSHPFCLLGKLENYFFIGSTGRGKERFLYPKTRFGILGTGPDGKQIEGMNLFLRINDNTPGNGDGSFSCRIKVWRYPGNPPPPPPKTQKEICIERIDKEIENLERQKKYLQDLLHTGISGQEKSQIIDQITELNELIYQKQQEKLNC